MTALSELPTATLMAQSPVVVRINGLPVSAVTALSSPRLLAAVRDALAVERWVVTEGRELADELHTVISRLADPALRPGAVGLRRSLFKARLPRPAEWSAGVRCALPAGVAARIERWAERLTERDRLSAAVAETLAGETERTATSLLEAAADPLFRHGLVQSSPALSAELEKWLADRRCRPSRQMIVRLARYLSRATTKTSPYSTFTTIGAGVWTTADAPMLTVAALPLAHGLLEMHGTVLAELATVLSTSDDLRPAMLVRTNPSLTRLGDRLAAIGLPPRERIASVAALPEAVSCVDILGTGWHTLGWLRARLSGGAPVERVNAFVDRLIDVGIIELRLPVEDQCRDWFGALATWLLQVGTQRWAGTARACAQLSRLLNRPTHPAEVDGHRARLSEIRRAVGTLRAEAGLVKDPTGRSALVHEHTAFTRRVATAGRSRWQPVLADLDRIRRWLAPHDSALALRIALGSYCGARFGAGASVPFVAFYGGLIADLDRYGAGLAGPADDAAPALADLAAELRPNMSTTDYQLPVLRDLATTRRRSLNAVLEATPDADGVVRVDPGRLALSASGELDHILPTSSVAWFVQIDGDRLVLNCAMSGFGRGRCRSLYLIAEANGGELPDEFALSTSDGADLVADSSGAFGHTLNLRLPRTGHELDYPFTVRLAERRPRVAVRDLLVEHDPVTGLARLRDIGSGALVTPVHAGMVVQSGLPPALRLLMGGLGANPGWLFRPADLLSRPVEPFGPAAGAGVGFAPRIEAGLVVLRRAAWTAAAGVVPQPAAGESDTSALLRLHRWLVTHGIPDRCFVTAHATPATSQPLITKARKPLYVDLTSPWMVAMFYRLISGADGVTFCEVLPGLGDGHVIELVVETDAVTP